MKKKWVKRELGILRKCYFSEQAEGVQKYLLQNNFFRTLPAIRIKARRLGIKGKIGRGLKDISGQLFGNWIEIEYDREESKARGVSYYKCTCSCGNVAQVDRSHLIGKLKQKSCGHCNDIIIGKMYNWLEPLCRGLDYVNPKTKNRIKQYICLCHYNKFRCKKYTLVRGDCLKNGQTQSCGCYNIETLSGKNNWNYKGGITKFYQQIRELLEVKQWKQNARKETNYHCLKCGKREYKLSVHHKKPFYIILEENEINNLEGTEVGLKRARNCKELLDPDNAAPLCEECHTEFHSIYGNNCTKEDFESWINNG